MILIILGLIIFLSAFSLKKMNNQFSHFAGTVRILGLIFIALGFLTSCIKQIDAGEIGVKSLFGKVQNDVLSSGLTLISIAPVFMCS